MRTQADVGLQGQDRPHGDGMDRARVLAEVEQPALRPAVVKHALLELDVADRARLAVPERPQAQPVALLAVVDQDLQERHVGPGWGLGPLGLARGLVGGVEDGQADGGVGAGVLPALQDVEAERAPDDAVEGRDDRLLGGVCLAQALVHPRVAVLGVDALHGLEHQPLGRRERQDGVQALEDVLPGGALPHEPQQSLDGLRGRVVVRGGHEVHDRVLRVAHGPGHRGLHGAELELALAPQPVVGHAHPRPLPARRLEAQGVCGRALAEERVQDVDAGAQDLLLVARGLGGVVRGGVRAHAGVAGGGLALGVLQGFDQVHEAGWGVGFRLLCVVDDVPHA